MVAVAPDAYIVWNKHRQPRWRCAERLAVVSALHMVDQVVVHGIEGAADVIRKHRPRLFVKGKDWTGTLPDDVLKACHDAGTAIMFVDSKVQQHTSDTR